MVNKFNTGDYVKWIETSKSGKEYYEKGLVVDSEDLFSKVSIMGNPSNLIRYTILTEEGEEKSLYEDKLERDVEAERENSLKRFFDDNNDNNT